MPNKEKEIIQSFLSQLPTNKHLKNNFFESDAEIIEFGYDKLLFTTDEFSSEDLFRDHDPQILDWNLAVCTISDILASGGKPLFYGHSVQISKQWDQDFLEKFSKGIASVLEQSKSGFIGGDLGLSEEWRYTGICLGTTEKPLSRKGTLPEEAIYMTGKAGAGNLEAALVMYSDHYPLNKLCNSYQARFPLRIKESHLISKYASCCIDTSDGILNALNTIAELNNVGYIISMLPYSKEGKMACKIISKPIEILFMGECGEYELLFTIKKSIEKKFIDESKKKHLHFTKIGEVTSKDYKMLSSNKSEIQFNDFDIYARNFENVSDYISELINYLKNNKK
ncbi:AIR synthase related protein [Bacteroidota bacterium]